MYQKCIKLNFYILQTKLVYQKCIKSNFVISMKIECIKSVSNFGQGVLLAFTKKHIMAQNRRAIICIRLQHIHYGINGIVRFKNDACVREYVFSYVFLFHVLLIQNREQVVCPPLWNELQFLHIIPFMHVYAQHKRARKLDRILPQGFGIQNHFSYF